MSNEPMYFRARVLEFDKPYPNGDIMNEEKINNELHKKFRKIDILKESVKKISYKLPLNMGKCSLLKKQLHYNSEFDLVSKPTIKFENPSEKYFVGENIWVYINNFILQIELNDNIYDVRIDIQILFSKNFLIYCTKNDFVELLISKLKNAIYVILSDTNKKTDTIQYRSWTSHIAQIYNYEIIRIYHISEV